MEHRVNTEALESLTNWVNEYDLTCAPKSTFDQFGRIFLGAAVLGSLIFVPLVDRFGRKPITLAGVAIAAIS